MNKRDFLIMLYKNNGSVRRNDAITLIKCYLKEQGIEKKRINEFLELLLTELSFVMSNKFGQCVDYCIDYYIRKFDIVKVMQDDKIIQFY